MHQSSVSPLGEFSYLTSVASTERAGAFARQFWAAHEIKGDEMLNAGAVAEGLRHVKAAAFFQAGQANIWETYGRVHMQLATKELKEESSPTNSAAFSRLLEAHAAFQLSGDASLHLRSQQLIERRFPSAGCPATDCAAYRRLIAASTVLQHRTRSEGDTAKHLAALHDLCGTAKQLRFRLTESERTKGWGSAQRLRDVMLTLRTCGAIVLSNVLDPHVCDALPIRAHELVTIRAHPIRHNRRQC